MKDGSTSAENKYSERLSNKNLKIHPYNSFNDIIVQAPFAKSDDALPHIMKGCTRGDECGKTTFSVKSLQLIKRS